MYNHVWLLYLIILCFFSSLNDNEFVCEDINEFSGTILSFYVSHDSQLTSQ